MFLIPERAAGDDGHDEDDQKYFFHGFFSFFAGAGGCSMSGGVISPMGRCTASSSAAKRLLQFHAAIQLHQFARGEFELGIHQIKLRRGSGLQLRGHGSVSCFFCAAARDSSVERFSRVTR